MNPVTNPYAPGAGTPPPLLAGRDGVIEAWDVVIGRAAAGNSFQPIVLSGLRGVGKTVLLLAFRQHAIEAGWSIELFEARPGGDLRAQIAEALPPMIRNVNRRWRNQERAQKIGRIAASFARAVQARLVAGGFRIELEPEPGYADTGDLETDLTELLVALGEGARDEGVGAALLIDELHEVPPEQLSALIGAAHRVNQERLPVVVGGAGLPPVGRVLSEARSYSERLFSIRPVGALSPTDTREAFEEPAAELGVAFEAAALDELVELSGGYPFFIQSYGKHVWDVADDSPIAPDDVDLARPRASRELVDSFFRPALRPGHAGRAPLHARDGRHRRQPGLVGRGGDTARPRPAGPGLAAARRAAHEGPHLRPRSWPAGVHGPAHGGLPARPAGTAVTSARFRIWLAVITAIGAAWRIGYLVVAKFGEPLLLNDSLYFSIQAGRNSEGDWFREGLTNLPGAEHGPLTSLYLTPWSLGSGDNVRLAALRRSRCSASPPSP